MKLPEEETLVWAKGEGERGDNHARKKERGQASLIALKPC